jgi:hypothetical protein
MNRSVAWCGPRSTSGAARRTISPRAATSSGPPPFVQRWPSSPACWEMSDPRARVGACS